MPRKKKSSSAPAFLKIFISLCLVFGLVYFTVNHFLMKPHVFYPGFDISLPTGYDLHGIDVSRYQHVINWQEVKEMEADGVKITFAFIKATEGGSHVDAQFARNWLEAGRVGIIRGAYHFFVPGRDAKRQAKNFTQIVNLQRGDLPPVLDVEKSGRLTVEKMREDVRTWLLEVESNCGVKPVIYTNISFYEKYFSTGFEAYPLWIAHYLEPRKPRIDKQWIFWQHSETGRVNGIRARVDFNVFNGDDADLQNLLIKN